MAKAFAGKDTVAEEEAEHAMIKKAGGSVKKAMNMAKKGPKMAKKGKK